MKVLPGLKNAIKTGMEMPFIFLCVVILCLKAAYKEHENKKAGEQREKEVEDIRS